MNDSSNSKLELKLAKCTAKVVWGQWLVRNLTKAYFFEDPRINYLNLRTSFVDDKSDYNNSVQHCKHKLVLDNYFNSTEICTVYGLRFFERRRMV